MIKKVLIATMSLGIGGAETHIIELALELKRRGIDVLVASNGGVYVSDLDKVNIPHFTVPMDRRNLRCMIKSYFLMRKLIKKEAPDIVHAHARIPGFICGLLHKTLRISRPSGASPTKKRKVGRKMKFSFVTTAHWVFELSRGLKYLTNWGEKTIAVSKDIKTYLTENYDIKEEDIFVTVNSVDTEKFSPEKSGERILKEFDIPADAPVILTIGRLDDVGTRVGEVARCLIESAPELAKHLPNVRIIVTGKAVASDGTFEKMLYKMAEDINASLGYNAVIMTGQRTDVNELLAACTLFVGVSRAALEAMAVSKPVILAGGEGYIGFFTSDKLQIAVDTNFCCRGCQDTTTEVLATDIQKFFSMSQAERKSAGDYGRELILRDYSVGKLAEDCLSAYRAAYRPRYNIVMSGYYGFKNIGDDAILQSIHKNITELCDDISITVMSSDPEDTKSRYGYEAVNSFSVLSVIKAIKRSNALISGGGSLLQDITSTRSLIYYLFIIRMAKLLSKKIMLYANGIGPVMKPANRSRVRRALNRADVITLRDPASLEELRSMGMSRDDMIVTADPVFTMNGTSPEVARKIPGIPQKPFITVSVREWPGMGDFCKVAASICDDIYEHKRREIVFISMQTGKDLEISRRVQGLMKNPSHIIEERLSAEELMGVIGLSDVMLAMRLHALIFAARMNVPFASIMHDPKVSAYTAALSMPSAGEVTSFDRDTALSALTELLDNRDDYSNILKEKSTALCEAAKKDPTLLISMLQES